MAMIDKAMQRSTGAQRQGLRSVWTTIQVWVTRRRARKTLARLDDHMLRDIGMTRHTARQECTKPFWQD